MAATQKNRITVVVSTCNKATKPRILLFKQATEQQQATQPAFYPIVRGA